MRHSTITLTLQTYGHLFPGAEAEAVGHLHTMLDIPDAVATVLRATGTDDKCQLATQDAQRSAQRAARSAQRAK